MGHSVPSFYGIIYILKLYIILILKTGLATLTYLPLFKFQYLLLQFVAETI